MNGFPAGSHDHAVFYRRLATACYAVAAPLDPACTALLNHYGLLMS
jgi:hypothetical protein